MKRTYQTRLALNTDTTQSLSAYAGLFGRVERTLFAEAFAQGTPPAKKKAEYLRRFGITARQFNAVSRALTGKVEAIKSLRDNHLTEAVVRIKKARKVIAKLQKKEAALRKKPAVEAANKLAFKIHHKQRRLATLERKQATRLLDKKDNRVSLCFGSKKLFHAQYELEANGYKDHQEWRQDWIEKRNAQFYVIGSKDETSGCQGCVVTQRPEGDFLARLRLPDSLITADAPKQIALVFDLPYGKETLQAALKAGQSISYRFVRDEKGWRLFVTTDAVVPKKQSHEEEGSLGVDVNADHLAVTEIDRFGNWVESWRIPLVTYGLSTDQSLAAIGGAVKALVALAAKAQKPVIIEALDFKRKKAELERDHPKLCRMLSSFAYNRVSQTIQGRCLDAGIACHQVSPAYTSQIGLWKFASRYGMTAHQAAAMVIARRYYEFSERPNRRDQNASLLPARKVNEHVWSFWGRNARRKVTLAALHRLRKPSSGQAVSVPCDTFCVGSGTPYPRAGNTVRPAL
jgi:IS605 OrfB family transposase